MRARDRGAWKVDISYDPRSVEVIYLWLDGGRRLEPCQLLAASRAFRGRDWHEVADYFAREKQAAAAARTRSQQSQAALHAQQKQIVSAALERAQAAQSSAGQQSKRARTRGIRDHRCQERQYEREQSAWRLGIEQAAEQLRDSAQETDAAGYVPPACRVERIRELREREWRKHDR